MHDQIDIYEAVVQEAVFMEFKIKAIRSKFDGLNQFSINISLYIKKIKPLIKYIKNI